MNVYSELKDQLLQLDTDISFLLKKAKSIPGMADQEFRDWEKTLADIYRQIREDTIRVAAVGSIKSGKSTFVNSLLKDDYLKRGAGIITSIVTRVVKGEILRARLFLKSWDEVNADLRQALVLFPSTILHSEASSVDIRKSKDRQELSQAMDSLDSNYLFTKDTRNVNSILLDLYLKGYDRVKDIMSSDNEIIAYTGDQFKKHMDFVGDDALAVYLKDVCLEIRDSDFNNNIELADCQGSDSPNPLHLAMIQDYLLKTHLIIYLISSRTGLRSADIKFLSIIRKMGIIDNTIFVINCDFSEHESKKDLVGLVKKNNEELSLIAHKPEVYTISALYNLFKSRYENLSERDRDRLSHWEKETSLTEFSDQQTSAFLKSFHQKLTAGRYQILLKNHCERLNIIASGLNNWIEVNENILGSDANSVMEISQKIKEHQKGMSQVRSIIRNTLDGAIQKLKKDLRNDIDRFFDPVYSEICQSTLDFIRGYRVTFESNADRLEASGFSSTLYLIFQEFKQNLDAFMTENVNPEIIRFIKASEAKMQDQLMMVAKPFDGLIQDALSEYNATLETFGIHLKKDIQSMEFPDMESVKNISGLSLPPARAALEYSAKIRTESVLRLGVYRFFGFFRKVFKKATYDKRTYAFSALKDGVNRIKRETEKSILYHFKDYRENIKFQYIFKLVDSVSNALYEALLDRFQAYVANLSLSVEQIQDKGEDKEDATQLLEEMKRASEDIRDRISRVSENIRSFF